jgi:hypothetical protein
VGPEIKIFGVEMATSEASSTWALVPFGCTRLSCIRWTCLNWLHKTQQKPFSKNLLNSSRAGAHCNLVTPDVSERLTANAKVAPDLGSMHSEGPQIKQC